MAVTLDGRLPRGENWHQELLPQVAEPGGAGRPSLWSGSLLLELNEYRKFRLMVVGIYGVELKPARVRELAENASVSSEKSSSGCGGFLRGAENRAQLE